jgi:DNA polymerase-3 subunit epsilon
MREIVLDTETTGTEATKGDRVIEIGGVELLNHFPTGRSYHVYINPQRAVSAGALAVHGLSDEFLADKPVFAAIVEEFLAFVGDARLVIHNAAFDIGFLNEEFRRTGHSFIGMERVVDTLALARRKHPGAPNNLDALCSRYGIDNSRRTKHGALLDAEILADVYLLMTGGQSTLTLGYDSAEAEQTAAGPQRLEGRRKALRVIRANEEESEAHQARLQEIDKASGGKCLWRKLETPEAQPA